MALSGTYYGSWLGSGYQRVYLNWSATQDYANNTSTITATLVWQNTAGVSLSSSTAKNVSITIAGQTFTGTATVGIGANTTKTLLTASKVVAHNSDGSLTTDVAGWFELKFTLGGTYYNSTSTNGSPTLDPIPRTSPIASITGGELGSSVTVTIDRKSTVFNHTVVYRKTDGTDVNVGTIPAGSGTTASFTPALSDSALIPNATSGIATIFVHTYSGSTYIGTSSMNFTVTVPASVVPTVSNSVTGNNLTGGFYTQNRSTLNVTVTESGNQGSTITYRNTSITGASNNGASSFTSSVLTASGTVTIQTTITDSRGRSASYSRTITVYAYSNPIASSVSASRCDSDGTDNPSGAYMKITGSGSISPVNNANGRTASMQYKVAGSGTWTVITPVTNTYTPSLSYIVLADVNNSFDIRFYIADSFNSAEKLATISTAFVLMDFHSSGNSMAIGKVAEGKGVMEFGGDVYITGGFQANLLPNRIVTSGLDFNTLIVPGMYYCSDNATAVTLLNRPTNYAFSLLVEKHAGIKQTVTEYMSSGAKTFTRNLYSGTWGAWENLALKSYPVGAIYMSTVSTSPATLFGGTWSALGGRMLIGVDGTYTNGSTGGSATQTLTEANMPAHVHNTTSVLVNASGAGTSFNVGSGTSYGLGYGATYSTDSKGSGTAHNNMPPYLAVYMWKRTA